MSKATDLLLKLGEEISVNAEMVDQYLATALWSSTDSETDEPYDDAGFSIHDFSQEARKKAEADLKAFVNKAGELLNNWGSPSNIGHDFWLTRNNHGAGFWDRKNDSGYGVGDKLTDIAKEFQEINVIIGDDGKLDLE